MQLRLKLDHSVAAIEHIERKGLSLLSVSSSGGYAIITVGGDQRETARFFTALQALLPDGDLRTSAVQAPVATPEPKKPAPAPASVPAPTILVAPSHAPDAAEDEKTNRKVVEMLQSCAVPFETSTHAPVRTSEEAAQVRGATLASGAKAMLLSIKPSNEFVLAVISAAAKMDSKAARKAIGCKTTRFATEEEVRTVTGCLPGAVPPFGSVWGIRSYMDTSLQTQGEEINFNAGLRTFSIKMTVADYLKAEGPTVCSFSGSL